MGRSGFNLMEVMLAAVIIGIATAVTLPNFNAAIERNKAQTAENNLMAISAGQQKYYEDSSPAAYCVGTCADTTNHLNSSLHLGISDGFTYSCATVAANIPYNCTAVDGTDTVTLDPNANPIVSCCRTANCAGANNGYCPS